MDERFDVLRLKGTGMCQNTRKTRVAGATHPAMKQRIARIQIAGSMGF
jgi:hypothetical protein